MFYYAHSGIRYVVLALAVAALAYSVFGAVTRREYDKPMRMLASGYAGSLHLQLLMGIALGLTSRFATQLIGHVSMMLFAAAAAQIPVSVMKRRAPEARTYPPQIVFTLVSLLLIYFGMASIGRGLF